MLSVFSQKVKRSALRRKRFHLLLRAICDIVKPDSTRGGIIMSSKTKKVIGIIAAVALILALIGNISEKHLQNKDKEAQKSSSSVSSSSSKSSSSSSKSSSSSSKSSSKSSDYISLDEYVRAVKKQVNENGGLDDEYTLGNIYTESQGMVYDYTLKKQNAGLSYVEAKQTVRDLMDENDNRFQSTANEVHTKTGQNYRLRVVYHNADGSVIEERTYQ